MTRPDERSTGNPADLVETFFSQVRGVFLGEARYEVVDLGDIMKIAEDRAASAAFRKRLPQETQNAELKSLVVEYIREASERLTDGAEVTDIKVEFVEKAGIPVALSVTGAAIAAIFATGGAPIPIAVLSGGVLGLAALGLGRTMIKLEVWKRKAAARKISKLISGLE